MMTLYNVDCVLNDCVVFNRINVTITNLHLDITLCSGYEVGINTMNLGQI